MKTTPRSPFNAARLVGGTLLVAVLSSIALSAAADGGPGRHAGPGGHGGQGMGMMEGRMAERMLDSVNASPEQRAQIKQITERARADMKAQHEAGRALREQGMRLFTQPTVDANAAEALRQQMLHQHDQASRRRMQALIEVSRVLTPEQRKQLAERIGQRRDMMQRHMQERRSMQGGPARQ